MRGPPGTPFERGIYHGRIILPPAYPYKPPSIIFLTKNGRFEVGRKICLSISAYHPETWQPAWGLRLMLQALISFFPTPGEGAIGAVEATDEVRRALAERSRAYSCASCGAAHALVGGPDADAEHATSGSGEVPRGADGEALVLGRPKPSAAAAREAAAGEGGGAAAARRGSDDDASSGRSEDEEEQEEEEAQAEEGGREAGPLPDRRQAAPAPAAVRPSATAAALRELATIRARTSAAARGRAEDDTAGARARAAEVRARPPPPRPAPARPAAAAHAAVVGHEQPTLSDYCQVVSAVFMALGFTLLLHRALLGPMAWADVGMP